MPQDITLEELVTLNQSMGMIVEINDGQISKILYE